MGKISDSQSLALNLGGIINWPLYKGGRTKTDKLVSKERLSQAEYGYSKAIIAALQDIENSGSRLVEYERVERYTQGSENIQSEISQNNRSRDKQGVIDLVLILQTDQAYIVIKRSLNAARANTLRSNIALHKALGGDHP